MKRYFPEGKTLLSVSKKQPPPVFHIDFKKELVSSEDPPTRLQTVKRERHVPGTSSDLPRLPGLKKRRLGELADYPMQIMILDQEKKRRLMMKRDQQVLTTESPTLGILSPTRPQGITAEQDYAIQLILLEQQNERRELIAQKKKEREKAAQQVPSTSSEQDHHQLERDGLLESPARRDILELAQREADVQFQFMLLDQQNESRLMTAQNTSSSNLADREIPGLLESQSPIPAIVESIATQVELVLYKRRQTEEKNLRRQMQFEEHMNTGRLFIEREKHKIAAQVARLKIADEHMRDQVHEKLLSSVVAKLEVEIAYANMRHEVQKRLLASSSSVLGLGEAGVDWAMVDHQMQMQLMLERERNRRMKERIY